MTACPSMERERKRETKGEREKERKRGREEERKRGREEERERIDGKASESHVGVGVSIQLASQWSGKVQAGKP